MADERVSLGKTNIINSCRHIARYNLALSFVNGKRVLDAACGTGYGSFLLSLVNESVVGIDNSPEAVLEANKRFTASNLAFILRDLNEIDEKDCKPFDAVVCFETLEHLENPQLFIDKLKTIVKKGGLFVYSLPLFEKMGQNQHHKHVFDVESARSLVKYPIVAEYVQSGMNFYYPYEVDGGGYYFSVREIV